VACSRCGATSTHSVESDSLRTMCSACGCRLTLPGTIHHNCPHCRVTGEYRHLFAGHSIRCHTCDQAIVLPPIIGHARRYGHRRRIGPHGSARRRHTLAFSDSAERSLILVAAAVATIIFVMMVNMM